MSGVREQANGQPKETTKALLRKAALARRAEIPADVREAFQARIAIEGVKIARQAVARTVAAYWPMRGEADAQALMIALDYHEFVAALPAMEAVGRPLVFRQWRARDPLVEGPFGTVEPSARAREVVPDILFVPLAAFDRRGHRIGYGAGCYDVTLEALRGVRQVIAIGVAFSVQEVPAIPEEAHDQRLDYILTENEFITCRTE
jgi:5-formyltetrahydrofolate cyclo-ligase